MNLFFFEKTIKVGIAHSPKPTNNIFLIYNLMKHNFFKKFANIDHMSPYINHLIDKVRDKLICIILITNMKITT